MKKSLFLILCVALSVAVLSCATGGGGGGAAEPADLGPGVAYVGDWEAFTDANDGGSSTIEMEILEIDGMPAYRFTGNVTTGFQWGFVGWQITPDADTLARLKTARAISFMARGDGQRQTVKYRISNVRDHAYHEFHFIPGEEAERFEVPIRMFMQPSWGTSVRMIQTNAEDVSFQTHESWRPGTFDVTIWDVRIH